MNPGQCTHTGAWSHFRRNGKWEQARGWEAARALVCSRCGGPIAQGEACAMEASPVGKSRAPVCSLCTGLHRSPRGELLATGKRLPHRPEDVQEECPLCMDDLRYHRDDSEVCPTCHGTGVV